MSKTLKILLWNSNGLLKHKNELEIVLNSENVDVCMISETHFTTQSYIKIKNYETYHVIHPSNCARGGSAIIIKSSIKHFEEEKVSDDDFQVTAVTINEDQNPLSLIALYSPPRYQIKCEQYYKLLKRYKNRFIMGGDFNAKNVYWGSRLTTTKGRELHKAMQLAGCDAVTTCKPTYWPTDSKKMPDLIDFFIVNKISRNFLEIEDSDYLNSDHSPIFLSLSENIIFKEHMDKLSNRFTDWHYFKKILQNCKNNAAQIVNEEQLDSEVQNFTSNVQLAAWKSAPNIKKTAVITQYPKDIRDLISLKRKLRSKWHQTRAPIDKTRLNKMTKDPSRKIKKFKNDGFSRYLHSLSNDRRVDYSLWKCTKYLKRPQMHCPPLKIKEGKWANNNSQKAELYADYLADIFTPHEATSESLSTSVLQEFEEIPRVTSAELKREIKMLKKKNPLVSI